MAVTESIFMKFTWAAPAFYEKPPYRISWKSENSSVAAARFQKGRRMWFPCKASLYFVKKA